MKNFEKMIENLRNSEENLKNEIIQEIIKEFNDYNMNEVVLRYFDEEKDEYIEDEIYSYALFVYCTFDRDCDSNYAEPSILKKNEDGTIYMHAIMMHYGDDTYDVGEWDIDLDEATVESLLAILKLLQSNGIKSLNNINGMKNAA